MSLYILLKKMIKLILSISSEITTIVSSCTLVSEEITIFKMSSCCCASTAVMMAVAGVAVVLIWNFIRKMLQVPPMPDIPLDQWWGPGQKSDTTDQTVRPFEIQYKDEDIEDLKQRLVNHRKPTPALEGIGFEYGFNGNYMGEVADFWRNKYDFKARIQYLNQYPHFKTNIQGLDVHFIHVKPTVAEDVTVLPMIIMHGWPGSVREFYELIPKLTTPNKEFGFVFELVVPSLPGFGFSEAAVRPGLGAIEVGVMMRNLMHRLGHKKFYIQGGDWGSTIGANMATLFQGEILGYHTNFPSIRTIMSTLKWLLGALWPSFLVEKKYENRMYPVSSQLAYIARETGYFHIQSTKPDTVGIALNDSPIGLAAYILEKMSSGTNYEWIKEKDGNLTKQFNMVDLLDNIMIYWMNSVSITSSMRLYAESVGTNNDRFSLAKIPTKVPTAALKTRWEVTYWPDCILRDKYLNLIHSTTLDVGGHFAAFEIPDILAREVWISVEKFEKFNKANNRKG